MITPRRAPLPTEPRGKAFGQLWLWQIQLQGDVRMSDRQWMLAVAQELKDAASEVIAVHMAKGEGPPLAAQIDNVRQRVAEQIDAMEKQFGRELEDTRALKWARWGILVIFGLLVLVGVGIVILGSKDAKWIGGAVAGTGVFGAIAWLLAKLHSSRKEDIGLAFTIARYKVRLAACPNEVCIQEVAAEIAAALEKLAG